MIPAYISAKPCSDHNWSNIRLNALRRLGTGWLLGLSIWISSCNTSQHESYQAKNVKKGLLWSWWWHQVTWYIYITLKQVAQTWFSLLTFSAVLLLSQNLLYSQAFVGSLWVFCYPGVGWMVGLLITVFLLLFVVLLLPLLPEPKPHFFSWSCSINCLSCFKLDCNCFCCIFNLNNFVSKLIFAFCVETTTALAVASFLLEAAIYSLRQWVCHLTWHSISCQWTIFLLEAENFLQTLKSFLPNG